MLEITYPYFNKDRILKKDMLENMRDYPRDVVDVYNEKLSDGIVCGLTPTVDRDIITFSKGIIKYKSRMYVIHDSNSISYKETDSEVVIKLNFYDEIRNKDCLSQFMDIEIDSSQNILDNQIELGRFRLKKGAYLRSNYQDLYDFTTNYNTINIVNVLYSGVGEPTINNLILKYYAKAVLSTRTQNNMDMTFSMLCLNSDRVERGVINNYIAYKLEEEIKPLTNEELHQKLVEILGNIKKENSGLRRKRAMGQKIIVD